MKRRLVDSTLDAVRIVVVVVLFVRFHHSGGSDINAWNSTEVTDVEGISQNATEFLEERVVSEDREGRNESEEESLNSTSTAPTNAATRSGPTTQQQVTDLIGGRHERIRRVQSRLDSSDCTLQAVFHEITGRLLNHTSPCRVQYFTVSRQIPLSNSTNWTHSYSFGLSALRNGNIVNASILFPVSVARATGNWSSLRIGAEIQLIGSRGVASRALSSTRFRRRDFPENVCVQVYSTTIIKELIGHGNEVLVTNVRLSSGSGFSNSDLQIREPFVRVEAMVAEPCPFRFSMPT